MASPVEAFKQFFYSLLEFFQEQSFHLVVVDHLSVDMVRFEPSTFELSSHEVKPEGSIVPQPFLSFSRKKN